MRKSERRIQKYGKCMNEKCENYRQALPVTGEMVCPKCKKKLIECPPPPPPTPIWKYAAGGCLALAVCVGGYFGISSLLNRSDMPGTDGGFEEDTITLGGDTVTGGGGTITEGGDTIGKPPKDPIGPTEPENDGGKTGPQPQENPGAGTSNPQTTGGTTTPKPTTTDPVPPGSLNLGYATYTGQTKNGKPHGKGKLVYKQERKIVASQSYTAAPGDTYEGQFRDGKVSGGPGVWTHKHNGVQTQINP